MTCVHPPAQKTLITLRVSRSLSPRSTPSAQRKLDSSAGSAFSAVKGS